MTFLNHTPDSLAGLSLTELERLAVETGRPRRAGESHSTLRYRLQRDSATHCGRMDDAMRYDQMHHQSAALDLQAIAAPYNPYQSNMLGGVSGGYAAYQNALAQLSARQFNNSLRQANQPWPGLGMTGSSAEAQAKHQPVKPPYVPPQIAVERVGAESRVSIGGQTVIALDDAQEAGRVADRLEGASLGMGDEVPIHQSDDPDPDFVKNINAAFKASAAARQLRSGTTNNDIATISIPGVYAIPPDVVEKLGGQSKVGEFFASLNPLRRKSGH